MVGLEPDPFGRAVLSRHLKPGPGCGYTIALGRCERNILNEARLSAALSQNSSPRKIVTLFPLALERRADKLS
jgi:hypothetical protein